ncbi:hypothetical protein BO94DRAFT_396431 [Aspergillus sclerotioniger CBS 115572]|uniref:F-box domain-containing protein n=1 Tax=Aspergillus sclerotioniger CBS 115572 TaxID=1450535 RepID=A0A317WYQ4_9EURO|nr:hypothetical protein BO94DRAFT_396431 [Aspergillus sclerotioniger CBS 115572]PWY91526.1 hypothetical protein BO94DRAFT_396431 [Aspergillus sclerotioniger CBS 115572]
MSSLLLQLPNELLVEVLRHCPDFPTLWSFVHVSSRLSAIFNAQAGEIVNAVLLASVPPPTRDLIQAVVAIRLGSFEFRSYLQLLRHPLAVCQGLDPAVPPPLLRKLVGLSNRVHALAHLCLDRCLHQCESVLGLEASSPSWTEEQRAVLAIWRVQFFYELKTGERKAQLDWPARDLASLRTSTPSTFRFRQPVQCEQVWTAIELIHELSGQHPETQAWTCPPHRFQLPQLLRESDFNWDCPPAPSPQALAPNRRPRERAPDRAPMPPPLPGPGPHPSTRWPAMPSGTMPAPHPRVTRGFGNWPEWKDLERGSVGWELFRTMASNHEAGSLTALRFDPYRKFGLLFWEEQRMVDWGLWPQEAHLDPAGDCYQRWRELLGEEEIARNSGQAHPTTSRATRRG